MFTFGEFGWHIQGSSNLGCGDSHLDGLFPCALYSLPDDGQILPKHVVGDNW